MKMTKLVLAVAVTASLSSFSSLAADCGCTGSSYDKKQDLKIDSNTTSILSLKDRDAQLAADIHNTYVLANTKYTESAGKFLEGRVDDLQKTKVDLSVFEADQKRQDDVVSSYAAQGAAVATDLYGKVGTAQETATGAQQAAQVANDRATNLETRADVVEGAVRETNAQVAVTDERSINNAVRLDGVEQKNVEQDTHINAVQDVASAADSRSQNNAVRLDTAEGAIRETNTQLAVTDSRSINNAVRLDGVEKVNGQQTKMLDNHETRITQNTSEIVKTQSTVAEQGKVINNHETRITNNETNISSLSQDFQSYQDVYNTNNTIIQNNMNSGDARTLSQSKEYTNDKFNQLKGQVDRNREADRKEYRSGIAGVAAMANIPAVPGQTFSVGAGIGQYKDQTAVAVGGNWNVSQRVAVKASVGFTNEDATAGAGVAFGF